MRRLFALVPFGLVVGCSLLVWRGNARAGDDGKPAASAPAFEVETIKDVVYRDVYPGEDAARDKNKLDLYLPRGKKDFPVLFFVHGGAWVHGDKGQLGLYGVLGRYWAQQGIGTVVINYRLSPGVKHPEHIKDVAQAFAWTKNHIAEYGGRADEIFVSGHSAGGHLVALLASDESYLKAHGMSFKDIRGAIPISGVFRVYGFETPAGGVPNRRTPFSSVFGTDVEIRKQASPLTHAKPGLPPFLILYADRDMPTLGEMAQNFGKALAGKHCDVQTLEIKERTHITVLLYSARTGDPAAKAIRDFINKNTGAN